MILSLTFVNGNIYVRMQKEFFFISPKKRKEGMFVSAAFLVKRKKINFIKKSIFNYLFGHFGMICIQFQIFGTPILIILVFPVVVVVRVVVRIVNSARVVF